MNKHITRSSRLSCLALFWRATVFFVFFHLYSCRLKVVSCSEEDIVFCQFRAISTFKHQKADVWAPSSLINPGRLECEASIHSSQSSRISMGPAEEEKKKTGDTLRWISDCTEERHLTVGATTIAFYREPNERYHRPVTGARRHIRRLSK